MKAPQHAQLFQQAVKKASAQLQERGASRVSKEQIIEEIALYITYSTSYTADELELLDYWRKLETYPKTPLQNPDALEGMAQYLGHPSYATWKIAQEIQAPVQPNKRVALILVLVAAIVVLGLGIAVFFMLGSV